jgi:hypothetical protein
MHTNVRLVDVSSMHVHICTYVIGYICSELYVGDISRRYMYVCMYVCMFVCLYVYMYVVVANCAISSLKSSFNLWVAYGMV